MNTPTHVYPTTFVKTVMSDFYKNRMKTFFFFSGYVILIGLKIECLIDSLERYFVALPIEKVLSAESLNLSFNTIVVNCLHVHVSFILMSW